MNDPMPGTAALPARRGRGHGPARLLLLLCAGGLAMLPAVNRFAMAAPAPNSPRRDPSVSQAWMLVMGMGLHVVVTDPYGRVQTIDDTGACAISNLEMDTIPIHDRPGVPRIHGTHIWLEPEPGRYIVRVVCPENRTVYLDTRRWLMADCGAHDSMAIAAHDTASWSIEYSPASRSSAGPCWIRIRQPGAAVRAPTAKDPRPR